MSQIVVSSPDGTREQRPVASGTEVLGNRTIGGKETLGVPRRFKPLYPLLPLAGGLVRILREIIQIAMLAVLHPRQDFPLGGPRAFEVIGDDHPWNVLAALEGLAEELLGGLLVPPPLYEDIEHGAVLIDGPPERVALLVDREKDLVQVPCVTRSWTAATQLIRKLLAERAAPFPDGFVRHDHPTDEQEFFHIAVAERETVVEPDGVADDLPREAMMLIEIGRG